MNTLDMKKIEVTKSQILNLVKENRLTDVECLLLFKNLASDQQNKNDVNTQQMTLYTALQSITRK